MKITDNLAGFVGILFCALLVLTVDGFGQGAGQLLVNEVEIDPPSTTSDGCQYVEIRAANPGGQVPANTWFITIDNSAANPGNIAAAYNIGGAIVGSNGTITILNSGIGTCAGRTVPAGTTIVTVNQPLGLGFVTMSRAYLLVTSATPFTGGQNIDTNQDGQFDFPVTVIDGFAFNINPEEEFNYGGSPRINVAGQVELPDAVTRFSNNTTPMSAGAFYWGELAASPDETTVYAAPFSTNFPVGGALTPGGTNLPVATVPGDAVVDFDGDGRTDFSIFRVTGNDAFWHNSLNGSGTVSSYRWGAAGDIPVAEDYDGDGKDDVAVWRPETAAAFFIIQSSNNTVRAVSFGLTGDDPAVVGDWDGDGKADPAVYRNASAGQQSFFYYLGSSNNPTNGITFVPWGTGGDERVRGDFDGDDKQDAAVFRPSENIWYILQSSNSQLSAVPFGLASDVKVSGDFDGDHKTDQAIYRAGIWWIRQSGNGQIRAVTWGAAGDTPVPGDYDGDGSADFAVWRSGVYYIQSAGTGNITYFPWGFPSDQPVASVFNN